MPDKQKKMELIKERIFKVIQSHIECRKRKFATFVLLANQLWETNSNIPKLTIQ